MTQSAATPRVRAFRAAQALAGIATTAAGTACFDWRAGLIVFGLGLFATSAVWRAAA